MSLLNEKEKNNNHIGCDCSSCGNYSCSNEIQKKPQADNR